MSETLLNLVFILGREEEKIEVLEKRLEDDFQNKDLELEIHKLCEDIWDISEKIADELNILSEGLISLPIARKMITQKRVELVNIIKKLGYLPA